MKKLIIVSIIALLVPAMVFAADPAASAGAKSGSTVLGGVSSGTVAAGVLGVAFVGAVVLSNGGDGGGSSSGDVELPADLQASLDSLYTSLNATQTARLDYVLVQAASVSEVADVLSAVQQAVAAGATKAQIDAVFTNAAKATVSQALTALQAALYNLRAESPTLFGVVSDLVTNMNTVQLTSLSQVVALISTTSSFDAVAAAVEQSGTVTPVTPTHTPSAHFTPSHHNY